MKKKLALLGVLIVMAITLFILEGISGISFPSLAIEIAYDFLTLALGAVSVLFLQQIF